MNKLEIRMKEIESRKAEIRSSLEEQTETVDIDSINEELRQLSEEYKDLEKRNKLLEGINNGNVSGNEIDNPVSRRDGAIDEDHQKYYRSAWLKKLMGQKLNERELNAYNEEYRAYDTGASSALPAIPEATANAIIKKMYEVAPIIEKCRIYHIPGNFRIAYEGTNDNAVLHSENSAITGAEDKLLSVSLTGYEIIKLVKTSRAVSAMTISAFESYIVEIISESIARKIENYIFCGTGENQPGGVKTAGKGEKGAYTEGVDLLTIASGKKTTEDDIAKAYGMLQSGYERNAIWTMSKKTFFEDFYPLMNKSKNNLIEFANSKYYIMGCEVYFTGALALHEVYYGNYEYIIGNYSQDISVVRSEHSGLSTNSIDYLGSCVFDSKPIPGCGAFVKMAKEVVTETK